MPSLRLRSETTAAVAALRAALPIVRSRQGADEVHAKGPRDIVTGTDLAAQATIERVLREHHPECAFVGEEGDHPIPSTGRYWLVDPLCGTANYAARLPLVALNIALVDGGQVTASAVADGATSDLYAAERGRGAWLLSNGNPVRLHANGASGLMSLDPNLAGPDELRAFGQAFTMRVVAAAQWDVRMFATTLALAYVASGRLAAAVYASRGQSVHLAAGLLLAQESGAIVTNERGTDWTLQDTVYVVAATAELHRELQGMAQAVVAELTQ